jgi:hypothetical protein
LRSKKTLDKHLTCEVRFSYADTAKEKKNMTHYEGQCPKCHGDQNADGSCSSCDIDKVKAICDGLNAIGKHEWTFEYPGFLQTQVDDEIVRFGNNNETWDGDVTDEEGRDVANLRSEMVFNEESVAALVYVTQRLTDAYLES